MAEKRLYDTIVIRIENKTKKRLEQEADIQGMKVSSLVRSIISDYLQKDIVWQGQMQAVMEMLRNKIEQLNRDVKLFSDLWLYWVEFYFAYTKAFGDMDEKQKKLLIQEGRKRTELLVESFKRHIKEKAPGLVEKIVADYIVQDEK